MTTLVIVESPAKCGKIESFLGANYKCMASFGHIQELNGLGSIDFENNYTPRFIPCDSKKMQIDKLRKAILSSSEILLATDDDREGEAIAWHICKLFDLSIANTKRIIFHEITKPAILNAVANPSRLNMDLVNAQQARQVLDLIVGYKISPILWKNIAWNSKTGLSAGRCQTPALRLIYDNQKDIESSPGKMVYNTTAYMTKMNMQFVLNKNFEGKEVAESFLEDSVSHDHVFHRNVPKKTLKNPPTPLTTSTLQQKASNELHINPKETMSICQTLYEQGYITYMRTDSTTYSKEFINSAKEYITTTYGENYVHEKIDDLSLSKENKKPKKSKKTQDEEKPKAQEAHEAIRPTKISVLKVDDNMSAREKKMYLLIWKNTVASCMSPAQYSSLSAKLSAPQELEYKYNTEQVVFPGWKKVMGYDEECKEYAYLKTIKQDSIIAYNKITSKMTMKELKSHYTEAKLVQLLEEKGIGRPSTFSSLIDKIQERGYVLKKDVEGKKISCVDFELEGDELQEIIDERVFGNEKNKLVVQPVGKLVLEFLNTHITKLFDYDYTKNMEQSLDLIAKGESVWYNLCRECDQQIESETSKFKTENEKFSHVFDKTHSLIIGKYGPVIKVEPKSKTGKIEFLPVIEELDLDKVKSGELKMKDILKTGGVHSAKNIIGTYQELPLEVKKGKFGIYATWGANKCSLKEMQKEPDEMTLEEIIRFIENGNQTSGIVRTINENISIRNGKYGHYVYYKTKKMTKPSFHKLQTFQGDYKTCNKEEFITWFKELTK
jgi:DNA topoisomerase-1